MNILNFLGPFQGPVKSTELRGAGPWTNAFRTAGLDKNYLYGNYRNQKGVLLLLDLFMLIYFYLKYGNCADIL